jgi:RES domain-containing protein
MRLVTWSAKPWPDNQSEFAIAVILVAGPLGRGAGRSLVKKGPGDPLSLRRASFMNLEPHYDFDRIKRSLESHLSDAAPSSGVAYRSVAPQFANRRELLSGRGSRITGARWTPKGAFDAVYGSLQPRTAVDELFANHRYYGFEIELALPRVFAAFKYRLDQVLDLSSARMAEVVGISPDTLAEEDWRNIQKGGSEATAQAIGRAAWELRLQGLLVSSMASPGGTIRAALGGALASRELWFGETWY